MDRLEAATSATPQLRAVLDTLRAISSRQGGVLLRGELGCGREALARALHDHAHPSQPFVVVDIAAIPSPLLESVLFGHQ